MTTQHTPGPWMVGLDPEGQEDCQSVWTDTKGINAEIAGRICNEANASLIAWQAERRKLIEPERLGLRAAIEKATGGQS